MLKRDALRLPLNGVGVWLRMRNLLLRWPREGIPIPSGRLTSALLP